MNKLNKQIINLSSSKEIIYINDKSEGVKENLMKNKHKISITYSPNQWGLPITKPPLYIIDENYNSNWLPEVEPIVEKSW